VATWIEILGNMASECDTLPWIGAFLTDGKMTCCHK